MDARSESHAYPYNDVSGEHGQLNYEATVSRINDDQLSHLQSRGLTEDEAKLLIVSGFCEGVVRDLNIEYSVEMTRLIRMILEDGKAIAAPESPAGAAAQKAISSRHRLKYVPSGNQRPSRFGRE